MNMNMSKAATFAALAPIINDNFSAMMRKNEGMRQTFKFVEEHLEQSPCTDGPTMARLLERHLPELYAPGGTFPLSFNEANALDHYFFRVGRTGFWRKAFGNPVVKCACARCPADVGMFTFNLTG